MLHEFGIIVTHKHGNRDQHAGYRVSPDNLERLVTAW
jgi:hypothetical protein